MTQKTSDLAGEHFNKSSVAEQLKVKALNRLLEQGEKSGVEKHFDPREHLKKLHRKLL